MNLEFQIFVVQKFSRKWNWVLCYRWTDSACADVLLRLRTHETDYADATVNAREYEP